MSLLDILDGDNQLLPLDLDPDIGEEAEAGCGALEVPVDHLDPALLPEHVLGPVLPHPEARSPGETWPWKISKVAGTYFLILTKSYKKPDRPFHPASWIWSRGLGEDLRPSDPFIVICNLWVTD